MKYSISSFLLLILATTGLFACKSAPIIPPNALPNNESQIKAEIVWQVSLGDSDSQNEIQAITVDDYLFAASTNGIVSKIDKTGKEVWRVDIDESISAGVGADDSLVVIATDKGRLIALSNYDGKEVWRNIINHETLGPPKVTFNSVVTRTTDGIYYGWSKDEGSRLWVSVREVDSLTVRSHHSMLLVDEIIISSSPKATLVAFFPNNGRSVWKRQIARATGTSIVERLYDITSPAVSDGNEKICAVAFQGAIACLNLQNGKPLWQGGEGSSAGIAINGENLFAINMKDELTGYKLNSGEKKWHNADLFNRFLTTPISVNDEMVFADGLGFVHWVNPENGSLLGYFPTPGAIHNAIEVERNPRIIKTPPIVFGDLLIVQNIYGSVFAIKK